MQTNDIPASHFYPCAEVGLSLHEGSQRQFSPDGASAALYIADYN